MEKENLKLLALQMYEVEKELPTDSRNACLQSLVKQVVEAFGGVEDFVDKVDISFPQLPIAIRERRKEQIRYVQMWLHGNFYFLYHLRHFPQILNNAINKL